MVRTESKETNAHQIIVVGGGAAGLSLVVSLARKFRRQKSVEVVLIDQNPTHLWKPLLHEVATGSLDGNHDEARYVSLGKKHGFRFILARLDSYNVEEQTVSLAMDLDDLGLGPKPLTLHYDHLVLAVGSVSNDFNTPGVSEHAIYLDDRNQAEHFHRKFIAHLHGTTLNETSDASLSVVMVGGGATGVELAADLHSVASQLEDYGFESLKPESLHLTILEAGPRLLAQLPQRISTSVQHELEKMGVQIKVDSFVTSVNANEVLTKDGARYASDITVWAAGIKAPEVVKNDAVTLDNIGRIETTEFLNLRQFDNVFVIGDCCHCEIHNAQSNKTTIVPPRAQSALQMAIATQKNISKQMNNKPLDAFVYKDYGSLVSLSEYTTVGNLMGNLMKGTLFIEGWFARLAYRMLYRRHQLALYGWVGTALIVLGDRIHAVTRSHLKLH